MAFEKYAYIPKDAAKVVPNDNPQVKQIKEYISTGKKVKKSPVK